MLDITERLRASRLTCHGPRPSFRRTTEDSPMRLALAALLLAAAPAFTPAVAQDRPAQITPTRDVAVTYRSIGQGSQQPGVPAGMTMAWHAATQMMRTDLAGMGFAVVDQRAGRAFLVMEAQRMIMDIPAGQAMQQQGLPPNATFRREGTQTIAGHGCTVWAYQSGQDQGRACITADGVMLRAEGSRGGQSGGLEATNVAYGPQDPARFRRPEGYQSMPGMPGMPGAAPGSRQR
jgi:hypothetical protein